MLLVMPWRPVSLLKFVLSCGVFCAAQDGNNVSNYDTLVKPLQELETEYSLTTVHVPFLQAFIENQTLWGIAGDLLETDTQTNSQPSVTAKHRPVVQWKASEKARVTLQSQERPAVQAELQENTDMQQVKPLRQRAGFKTVQSVVLKPPENQEPKVLVIIEQRIPVSADSVIVYCSEGMVTVEAKQNFLGNGQLIALSDLTLGGCSGLYSTNQILLFQAALQDCGSTMMVTEDSIIYSFSLIYVPTPIDKTFIIKTSPANVVVKCHYPRRHYVSSEALRPTWMMYASKRLTQQQFHFSLRLMMGDWQTPRTSSVFYFGDVMHIEAAVVQTNQIPLRIYVDTCIATVEPEPNSQPRYPFIYNNGCFTDARMTGSTSFFLPRSQENKLQFLLKSFRFPKDPRTTLYIICNLKATTLSVSIDSEHKACSFLTEASRWVASGGDNQVCSCCETSCNTAQRTKRSPNADFQWEGDAALGPILIQKDFLMNSVVAMSSEHPEATSFSQTNQLTSAVTSSTAIFGGVGAAIILLLLSIFYTRSCKRTFCVYCMKE